MPCYPGPPISPVSGGGRLLEPDTIDTLVAGSEACTECADACLSESMVAELTKCIHTNMDCADICVARATPKRTSTAG